MNDYHFHERFAPAVESGQKTQTIRSSDKGAKKGDRAILYTGEGTNRRKLGEGILIAVLPIEIDRHACGEPFACIDPRYRFGRTAHLVHQDLDSMAREDGFNNGEEMVAWFESHYGLPFSGYLRGERPAAHRRK